MSECKIVNIEQTVFFREHSNKLEQLVVVSLDSAQGAENIVLEADLGGRAGRFPLHHIPAGASVHEAYLPDIRSESDVRFRLLQNDLVSDEKTIRWKPGRHWEVYLIQYAHHDLGYTDLPSNVLEEYNGFMDKVLEYCRDTEDWSDSSAKFRYLCEQSWAVDHFVRTQPSKRVEELAHFLRSGQIELTGLFGNQTLELCGHEQLVRLLYPAFEIARKSGVGISSAEHNDIPGFPWGLVGVLAGSGIRYFSPGVPSWYFGRGVEDRVHPLWDTEKALPLGTTPSACWWVGPDGSRVLLWLDFHGGGEWQPYDYEEAASDIPRMLTGLENNQYPYDMVSYTMRGGHRDNAPPTLRYSQIAREWNRRWAYPKIINSTNSLFLESFEGRWGDTLKTLRGDVPGTDYGVGAMCTPKETGVNRNAHDALLRAEKLASVAEIFSDFSYPREELAKAYRDTFYYDLHCWGPMHPGGAAAEAHFSEKATYAYRGASTAHDITVKAMNKLSDCISVQAAGSGAAGEYHLAVFNTLGFSCPAITHVPIRDFAPASTPMHWQYPTDGGKPVYRSGKASGRDLYTPPLSVFDKPFRLVDISSGATVPYQMFDVDGPAAAIPWAPERIGLGKVDARQTRELVFLCPDLPSVGYSVLAIRPIDAEKQGKSAASTYVTQSEDILEIENTFYKISVNRTGSAIKSIVDKETGRELVDHGAPHGFGDLLVRNSETGSVESAQMHSVAVIQDGDVFSTIRFAGASPVCPRITTELTIYHQLKRFDISARILKDPTPMVELYLAFPFSIPKPQFRLEAGGSVLEPIADQWPGSNTDYYAVQHWVDAFNDDYGVVWSTLDSPLAEIGGLWPGYVSSAHHGVPGPQYGHPFLNNDQIKKGHLYSMVSYNNFRTNFFNVYSGDFLVRHAFTSHAGPWPDSNSWQFGWAVANPPTTSWMSKSAKGSLDSTASFLSIDAPNVLFLTLKKAENGNGYILRFFETEGKGTTAKVRVRMLGSFHAYETNLVEEDQRALKCHGDEFTVSIGSQSYATVRLTTDPA